MRVWTARCVGSSVRGSGRAASARPSGTSTTRSPAPSAGGNWRAGSAASDKPGAFPAVGLGEQLEADLRQALRAGDAVRVSTIRLTRAAIKNAEIEKQRSLTDEEIQDILLGEVKRRREAIEAFERGGRDDLSRKEALEMAILTQYLPAPLSEEELRRIIAEVVTELRVASPADTGRVMAAVMPKVRRRAEGAVVNRLGRQGPGGGRARGAPPRPPPPGGAARAWP